MLVIKICRFQSTISRYNLLKGISRDQIQFSVRMLVLCLTCVRDRDIARQGERHREIQRERETRSFANIANRTITELPHSKDSLAFKHCDWKVLTCCLQNRTSKLVSLFSVQSMMETKEFSSSPTQVHMVIPECRSFKFPLSQMYCGLFKCSTKSSVKFSQCNLKIIGLSAGITVFIKDTIFCTG